MEGIFKEVLAGGTPRRDTTTAPEARDNTSVNSLVTTTKTLRRGVEPKL